MDIIEIETFNILDKLDCIKIEDINYENLCYVFNQSIKMIEKSKELTGKQKKAVVISVFSHLSRDHTYQPYVSFFTLNILPYLIDNVVDIANSWPNKKNPKLKEILKKMFCCKSN